MLTERLVSCRHRRTDRTSNRAVEHTENANGKRPRSGQGAGHSEQHDHTRREQLHGFERQVHNGILQKFRIAYKSE